ncbi:MAG TPA: sigma-70 family RNA polymerase sigma factor [Methylomirabilota bacterium]|nr:sigma-70 family RNA polymerase sigma factor [Methylomirabilota bacterium]
MNDDAHSTRPSLLMRLRDAHDEAAWRQFVEIYTPLVYGFCRRRDLQEADAADVAQEVMRAVARSMERFEYDPGRGRFRNWLLTVVRSKLNNFLAARQRQPDPASATRLQSLVEETQRGGSEQSEWDTEYHRQVFHWAAGRIRAEFQDSSWQAFWQTAVEQRDGREVATNLGLSLGAVYVAKSRVLARLRQEVHLVDPEELPGAQGFSGTDGIQD